MCKTYSGKYGLFTLNILCQTHLMGPCPGVFLLSWLSAEPYHGTGQYLGTKPTLNLLQLRLAASASQSLAIIPSRRESRMLGDRFLHVSFATVPAIWLRGR